MARLWSCGFELNTTSGSECYFAAPATISTSTKRSGTASMELPSLNSGSWGGTQHYYVNSITTNDTGPYYFRFYLDIHTTPNVNNSIFLLYRNASPFYALWLRLNTDRTLTLVDGTGDMGSSSALNTDTWYRIEILYDNTGGAGAGKATLRIDGSNSVSSTTRSFACNPRAMLLGGNMKSEACTTCDLFYDDIAINDSTGSYQTSWPGDGKIVHLRPDSAGDNAQWSQGAGGTYNWDRVSEVSPDDSTTYNKRTALGTYIDDHNCGSSSDAGIGAVDLITLVQVGCRIKDGSYYTAGADGILRIKSASGGTVQSSSADTWGVGGWVTNGSAFYPAYGFIGVDNYNLTAYVDPTTGVTWTPTGTNSIDNMQIGYVNNTSSTAEMDISTIWALVEYIQTIIPLVSDTTTITDSVSILITSEIFSVSDTATITDTNVIETLLQGIKLADTTTVTDTVSGQTNAGAILPNVSNTTTITDSVSLYETAYFITVSDTSTITDGISVYETSYKVNVSETTTVTDSVAFEEFEEGLVFSDTTTVTDSVTLEVYLGTIRISDTIAVTDSNFIWRFASFPTTKFYGQDY